VLDECGLDEETKTTLLNNIHQKLMLQSVKIRADVEVSCYAYEGVEAVKKALRAGLECSTEQIPVKINLIAPPLYGKSGNKIHNFFTKMEQLEKWEVLVPFVLILNLLLCFYSCDCFYARASGRDWVGSGGD